MRWKHLLIQMYVFVSAVFVSYGLAIIFSISFESPIIGLEKLIFGDAPLK